MYLGDFPADQAINFSFNTNDVDGASITRSVDGTISIYKDNSDGLAFDATQSTTGITNDEDFDGLTGLHTCCIITTNAWFETGHDYIVVISAATIGGHTVNASIAQFSIENRFTEVAPTVVEIRTEMDANSTKLDATISSRAPSGEYDTEAGYIPADLGDVATAAQDAAVHGVGSWESADAAPTVGEIRTEMEGIGTKLTLTLEDTNELQGNQGNWVTATGFATPNEYNGTFEDVKALLGSRGSIYYVSKDGDDSDGTTWAKAKTTVDAGIGLLTANQGDRLYIAPGTYDETANGANGVICDVEGIWIIGTLPGVIITNTDVTDNGNVFSITAHNTFISDVLVNKGETTSDGAIGIKVNGLYITADLRNITVEVGKATHTGIKFMGSAVSCSYMDDDLHLSHIYSNTGVGTGIEFADCIGCVIVDPQIHDLDYGMKFTGGASCHHNTVSPGTQVVSCDTGLSLDAGAYSNMLSALILNCTISYEDNSGVDTNKTEGSLTYVLSDIQTAIIAANPQTHYATADSVVTHGTVNAGTYIDTKVDNDVYWQVSPEVINGLEVRHKYLVGAGRVPSNVEFNGRFDAQTQRYCEVDAWNYSTSDWDQISSDTNRLDHATADYDRQTSLTTDNVQSSDGEIWIRIRSTSTTVTDDLYIDKLIVTSVAQSAGGLTADAVAVATTAMLESDFNTLSTDISTRAPSGEYDTEVGYIPADLGDVATAAQDIATHGAGSWESAAAAPTVIAIREEMDANSTKLDASVSSRAPSSEYDTEMGYIPADLGDVATAAQDAVTHGAGSWESAAAAPTVIAIREEMDANSTKLDASVSSRAPSSEYDTEMGYIPADLGDVATAAQDAVTHGAGSWEGGGAAPTVVAIREEMEGAGTKLTLTDAGISDIQSRIPAALVSGRMSSDLVGIAGSTDLVTNFATSVGTMLIGTAIGGTLSTTQMTTDLGSTGLDDENFTGRCIIFISNASTKRQIATIEEYVDATGTFTFTMITSTPIAGDTFIII